ncbi:helix-turn-helix domain-containing protein [Nocardioides piscis]|uniref:Helix-turn-helix domain-containing protein n=1 Tax=Nocardioides piscis TaxID=2714938 RepID=A0A6G7YD97_9ACTN|nr:helix-turn-helix domain-containing protein [Nocardioides piscis]QIK74699.1 helix-turn-helix domain-containing protein [Nocardioides piscis]
MIDVSDLALWLKVSTSSVKKWAQAGPASGRLPRFYRVNGQIRFRPMDVRAWLEGKAVE